MEPIVDENSRILILGTLPGDESLRLDQYYANSRNQFWLILSIIYQDNIELNYASRLCYLRNKKIALWDVLKSANRKGSLDSEIGYEEPNDFYSLFTRYPQIVSIGFNGQKAEKLFNKHCDNTARFLVSKSERKFCLRQARHLENT